MTLRSAAPALCLCVAILATACMATAPPVTTPEVPPKVSWEHKLAWIVRLEDQRLLRDPNPAAPAVVLRPATKTLPALIAPPQPSDLLVLLRDAEARVRRRATLAVGRVGLVEGVQPLTQALADEEPEVRQMAAFALGLIGSPTARPALLDALAKGEAAMQGRAAEALGLIGDKADGAAIGRMVGAHVAAGALSTVQADDLTFPLAPPVEAVRLGLFALARLSTYEPRHVEQPRDTAVMIQAIRALAALGDRASLPLLTRVVGEVKTPPAIRLEAMTAFGTLADAGTADILVELVSDRAPAVRGTAMRALARVDPDTFTATLSGLDADPDWTVRVAQAAALGTLPDAQGFAKLVEMADDRDVRVVPAVLAGLAASKAPGAEDVIRARLRAPDVVARAAAAQALSQLKATAAVPDIRAAYAAAAADPTYVARAALLAALALLDPAGTRPLLDAALKDKDWAVRVRAADLLREQNVTENVAAFMRPATAGEPVDSPAWTAVVAPAFSPHALIETDKGTIEIELAVLDAPLTSSNFVNLARKGFFDGLPIHRIVFDFVVQGGDPRGDGEGGPGYSIRDELNQRPYLRGTVGMALDWKDTGGSQFFITHSPAPHLDARYTVFGHVVAGMDVVDRLLPWDAIRRVRIRDGVNPE